MPLLQSTPATPFRAVLFAALLFGLAYPAAAQPVRPGSPTDDPVDRQILVMFTPDAAALPPGLTRAALAGARLPAAVRAVLAVASAEELAAGYPGFSRADTLRVLPTGYQYRVPDYTNLFVVTLPPGADRDRVVEALEALPHVVYAEKNARVYPRTMLDFTPLAPSTLAGSPVATRYASSADEVFPPGQTRFDEQWGLKNRSGGPDIRATFAWAITQGGAVTLGVIDSGVDATHRDLSGKVSGILEDNHPVSHGTHVAGIAAAKGNNPNGGTVGVDWYARVHSESYSGTAQQVAQAIERTVSVGARAINNSWGTSSNRTVADALTSAQRAGVLLVHANPYSEPRFGDTSDFPNNVGPWILNVGGVRELGGIPEWTGARSYTDVGAPGEHILSTIRGNTHGTLTGTSFSAPFVTGTAGLMLAANSNLRNYDLEQVLKRTARRTDGGVGQSPQVGFGMIDAHAAVRRVSGGEFVTGHVPAQLALAQSNYSHTFTSPPAPGLAAAAYRVDRYRLSASTNSISFAEFARPRRGRGRNGTLRGALVVPLRHRPRPYAFPARPHPGPRSRGRRLRAGLRRSVHPP